MFGYIKPYVPELKVAEYEKYRAAYFACVSDVLPDSSHA